MVDATHLDAVAGLAPEHENIGSVRDNLYTKRQVLTRSV